MSTNNYYTPSAAQKICLCVRGACVLINLEDTSLNMVSIENSCRYCHVWTAPFYKV